MDLNEVKTAQTVALHIINNMGDKIDLRQSGISIVDVKCFSGLDCFFSSNWAIEIHYPQENECEHKAGTYIVLTARIFACLELILVAPFVAVGDKPVAVGQGPAIFGRAGSVPEGE